MQVLAQNRDYISTLATEAHEIESTYRLRYQVFYEELKEGNYSEDGKETDPFDQFCEFILLKEKKTDEIVGLYRILPYNLVDPKIGYYTGIEFDLSNIVNNDTYNKSIAELGRLAIKKEHRGGTNLLLLWVGMVNYCKQNNIRYLLGCGSLPATMTKEEVEVIYFQLEDEGVIMQEPVITPRSPSEIRKMSEHLLGKKPNETLKDIDDEAINLKRPDDLPDIPKKRLPSLIRRYQAAGANIIGKPAFDAYDFGTYDFVIMVDLKSFKAQMTYFYIRVRLFLNRLNLM